MTSHAKSGGKRAGAPRSTYQWIPWAGLGLLVVVLVALAINVAAPGLVARLSPGRLWARLSRGAPPQASEPLSLSIVHSNDTWGYVLPCG